MKILLDECVTKRLKKYLEEFEVFTVRALGLSGIKNGKLLAHSRPAEGEYFAHINLTAISTL
jgi:predicted nuclease of predicted toxin-antitoxin system